MYYNINSEGSYFKQKLAPRLSHTPDSGQQRSTNEEANKEAIAPNKAKVELWREGEIMNGRWRRQNTNFNSNEENKLKTRKTCNFLTTSRLALLCHQKLM